MLIVLLRIIRILIQGITSETHNLEQAHEASYALKNLATPTSPGPYYPGKVLACAAAAGSSSRLLGALHYRPGYQERNQQDLLRLHVPWTPVEHPPQQCYQRSRSGRGMQTADHLAHARLAQPHPVDPRVSCLTEVCSPSLYATMLRRWRGSSSSLRGGTPLDQAAPQALLRAPAHVNMLNMYACLWTTSGFSESQPCLPTCPSSTLPSHLRGALPSSSSCVVIHALVPSSSTTWSGAA